MVIRDKVYTADDLWEISHHDDEHRYELIEGELVEMSPTGEEHGDIASELNMRIRLFVKEQSLGRVTAAETGYVLWENPAGKNTVLAPDVGFMSKSRLSSTRSSKFVQGAPDLAVEVLSPTDSYPKTLKKVNLFLKYGTRIVWIVDPKDKTVAEHRPNTEPEIFDVSDTLNGGDVLPGFTLSVKDIFSE